MSGPVVNIDAAPRFSVAPEGGSAVFGAEVSPVGRMAGARQLGAMLTVVEPGKRAFPFHNHHGNEEMFLVVAGTGEIRIGEGTHALGPGDLVACPAGGPETAHQIVNTGAETLRYLAISTTKDPDVVEYPDSGKVSVISIGEGRSFQDARLKLVVKPEDGRDYWEGEA